MTEQKPGSTKNDAPAVIMLPPVLVLFHVIAGITLDWAVPVNFGHAWGWLGLILLGLCFGIIAWARKLFDKAGTNIPPNMPSLAIVKDGPYQYTRNPMYVSFLLGFAGLSMLADAPLMLLLAGPLWYILDRHVIVPEEQYLAAKFGDEYLNFKSNVRRWI